MPEITVVTDPFSKLPDVSTQDSRYAEPTPDIVHGLRVLKAEDGGFPMRIANSTTENTSTSYDSVPPAKARKRRLGGVATRLIHSVGLATAPSIEPGPYITTMKGRTR
jgi:hypothetical protein